MKDQLVLAKTDLTRIESLRKRGTANQKQVDDRTLVVSQRDLSVSQTAINLETQNAKLAQQKAILDRLNWRTTQAERNLKDTVLKAPFSGIINDSQVEVGKVVSANDVVVSIYQADKMDVRFTLTDQRFGRIQSEKPGLIGRKIQVVWEVGGQKTSFPAVIDRIGAQITSNRGGVEVFASINDDVDVSTLRPGAFVAVLVPDKLFGGHFRIPESSVYGGNTVYVSIDGKLAKKSILVSGYDDDHVLISKGLDEGDELLVTRIAEISEGLAVHTESQAKAAAAKRQNGAKGQGAFKDLRPEQRRKAVEIILQKNNITRAQWDKMDRGERGPMIAAHRRDQAKQAKP